MSGRVSIGFLPNRTPRAAVENPRTRPLNAKTAADLTASVGTSDVVYPGILTQLTSLPSVPRANGLLPPQLMAVE
jgi:hypothetical protein